MYFILCVLFDYGAFLVISSGGKSFCFVFGVIFCFDAAITTLISISDGLVPYFFLSRDGKDAVYERRNGRRGVNFSPESAFFFPR